jgi:hypothetical protein
LWFVIVALECVSVAFVLGVAAGPGDEAGIAAVRAFTDRYHDESAAIGDGFMSTDECVPSMGYHYVNFGRFDEKVQPGQPEALLFAPTAGGDRVLAGAEYIQVDADQDLGTDEDRPSLFGHEFQGPMPGHVPGMPIHYDLHAYAWIENSAGGFETWNDAISCS